MDDALRHAINLAMDGSPDSDIVEWLRRSSTSASQLHRLADVLVRADPNDGSAWRARMNRLMSSAAEQRSDPPVTEPASERPPGTTVAGPPAALFDFPIYGIATDSPGRRWLDWVDVHDGPRRLVLGHDDGTGDALRLESSRKEALAAGPGDPHPDYRISHAAVLRLARGPRKLYGEQQRHFFRALIDTLSEAAADSLSWPAVDWTINAGPARFRYFTFAGRWVAYHTELGETDLTADGYGTPPTRLPIERITDAAGYGFDLTTPLSLIDSQRNRPPLGTPGPIDWHEDYSAVQRRAGIDALHFEPSIQPAR